MKIEQLIVQHLYNTKQVALQGIGIFRLRPDIIFPAESDKEFTVPADAFAFEYNLKTTEDEPLVDYIVQQTGKIKPLASADLDSYAILSRQFLNLGKPLRIEGVGTILKNQKGEYEFTAGHYVNPKIDDIFKQVKERKEDEVSFESESTPNNNSRNLKIFFAVAGIVLVGLALYYFLVLKNGDDIKSTEQSAIIEAPVKPMPLKTTATKTDSLKPKPDTVNKIEVPVTAPLKTDSSSFKIVIKEYNTQRAAQNAYTRLTSYGHKVAVVKVDSLKYKLVMLFTLPLSDTIRVKDSIKTFFGGKPYVQ